MVVLLTYLICFGLYKIYEVVGRDFTSFKLGNHYFSTKIVFLDAVLLKR